MLSDAPLAGLRVIEFAGIVAGPLVGQFCAELGADVIKVEPRGAGDPSRGWRLSSEDPHDDCCAYFSASNWGKRSIALDLKSDGDRGVAHQLVQHADVVIVSFRPGGAQRFGLDAESLRKRDPKLIFVEISAYGADDNRPGFDAIIQAEAGFTYLNGPKDGEATKMPVALVDILAAHQLKQGLLLALLKRERSGEGSCVSTSLLASATASLLNQASNYLQAGVVPQRIGSAHPNIVPYGDVYATSDGKELVIAVGTDRQFAALVEAFELSEVAAHSTNAQRLEHRDEVVACIRGKLQQQPADAIAAVLTGVGVPHGFVHPLPEVFAQPESKEQLFQSGDGLRTIALRGELAGARSLSRPPHLDEHGEQIRDWLGKMNSSAS
jgi:crotonobetainyl-CoA:carnitine CoA-transferase CaiB-like acyl-CoA transferase